MQATQTKRVSSSKNPSTHKRRSNVKGVLFHWRMTGCIILGCSIPILVLCIFHAAHASLVEGQAWLAFFGAGVGVSLLLVSLSHTSEAIRDLTRAHPWQAWCIAVTFDLGLVFAETGKYLVPDQSFVMWLLIVIIAVFSAVTNSYGFCLGGDQ